MRQTLPLLLPSDFPAIRRTRLECLQVNLGYRCNQSCLHCHVNAGPTRSEAMDAETIETVLRFLADSGVATLDITGGAPELHAGFRALVRRARTLGVQVMDRCNLTVCEEPDQQDLPEFLAAQRVEVIASLPCYLEENVDAQRGNGIFEKSLRVLRRLNALGYGQEGTGLVLNLVYNPQGAQLPPAQEALEADYKRELGQRHGVVFDRLFVLANMPIQRFGSTLLSRGEFDGYMALLHDAHRDENLPTVMCRSLISVDWRGEVYDCDFNQMLGLPAQFDGRPRTRLSELIGRDLEGLPIRTAQHCYGCTAGQGSSCGGALSAQG